MQYGLSLLLSIFLVIVSIVSYAPFTYATKDLILTGNCDTDLGIWFGQVHDESGDPVEDARLTVINSKNWVETTLTTDNNGAWSITVSEMDIWRIKVTKSGFSDKYIDSLEIACQNKNSVQLSKILTIKTDESVYDSADGRNLITVSGKVPVSNSTGTFVEIYFYTMAGKEVESGATFADMEGNYEYKITTLPHIFVPGNQFKVKIIHGEQNVETAFSIDASKYVSTGFLIAQTNVQDDATNNQKWIMIVDPTDKKGAYIKSLNNYVDDLGYLHIIGEFVNNQDVAYEFVKMIATLYDANGDVLDTSFSYTLINTIPPFMKTPFEITFSGGASGVETYKVQFSVQETRPLPMALALSKPRIYTDDIGYTHIVGEIHNNGETAAHFVKTVVTFYNSSGEVVGTAFTYATQYDIYPKQTSPFELVIGDLVEEPVSYALYAESSEYGLIYEKPISSEDKETLVENDEKIPKSITDQSESELDPRNDITYKDGCLIATAAFGSELAPQVQTLRETRDNVIMNTQSGASFMTAFNSVYYTFAPTVADWENKNPVFKEMVKVAITPLITTLSILNYAEIDSEAEMLGYGIGVILLNLGMYFVTPVFVIVRLRHKF